MAYHGPRLIAGPFHIRPFFVARRLGSAAAYALALFVVVAQPVASLAWLGGAHATPEQAALHEEAVEAGHTHHHGESGGTTSIACSRVWRRSWNGPAWGAAEAKSCPSAG